MIINAFIILQHLHEIINKLEKDSGRITKIINIRWINITGKE